MNIRNNLTSLAGIYGILDIGPRCSLEDALRTATGLLAAGIRVLQLRAKSTNDGETLALARDLRRVTHRYEALFLVNDRVDFAVLSDADGVHLGQTDLPPDVARRQLGNRKLVGLSCHSEAQARWAWRQETVDYIGFGPVYATQSKMNPDAVVGEDGLRAVCALRPAQAIIAIGGIGLSRLSGIRAAGATGAAMISGLLAAGDPADAARKAIAEWEHH